MAKTNIRIAIVTPLANEAQTLKSYARELFCELQKIAHQFTVYFVIDKASKDQTLEIAEVLAQKYPNLEIIFEPKNKNVVGAYLAGFRKAIKANFDFIIEMDAGFSHQPREIIRFVNKLGQGYDCVFGVRPLWSPLYHVPFNRRFFSLAGTVLANLLLKTRLSDMTSGFEAFSRQSLKKIIVTPLFSTGHFYQTEIKLRARRLGLSISTVPITYRFPTNSISRISLDNAAKTFWHYLWH